MEANIRIEHELLAVETEHDVHCMLELDVPAGPAVERPPLHLALVIDRSGSMDGGRLEVAKQCALTLAARLQPTDELALGFVRQRGDPRAPARARGCGPAADHAERRFIRGDPRTSPAGGSRASRSCAGPRATASGG